VGYELIKLDPSSELSETLRGYRRFAAPRSPTPGADGAVKGSRASAVHAARYPVARDAVGETPAAGYSAIVPFGACAEGEGGMLCPRYVSAHIGYSDGTRGMTSVNSAAWSLHTAVGRAPREGRGVRGTWIHQC